MRKTFIKKGFRELRQHKIQYFFLILILGLGVATYSSMNTMIDSRRDTFDAIYEESKFMELQIQLTYGETENTTTIEEILMKEGIGERIEAVEYRLTYDVFINITDLEGNQTYKGIIMGYQVFDPDGRERELEVNKPLYYVDDPPVFSSPDARECFLERKFSKVYNLEGGDNITLIRGQDQMSLEILEHVNIPEYFMVVVEGNFLPQKRSLGIVMMPLDTAQTFYQKDLGIAGNETSEDGTSTQSQEERIVNDIVLRLNDPGEIDVVKEQLDQEFEDAGIPVKMVEKEENPARAFLKDDIEGDSNFLGMFPIIIFTVSAFGLIMTLRRMIQTHRSQIGIFKALGIQEKVVLMYFATIGLIIAILGTILGWIIAIPLNHGFKIISKEIGDLALQEYGSGFEYYVYSGIISTIICLFCTIIPAWIALKIKPIDAMQNREGISRKSVGKITGSLGKEGQMSVPVKLTMRNLLRKPGRTMTSIIGVALSLALFLGFVIMLDSVLVVMDDSDNGTWDYEVGLQGFQDEQTAENWKINFSNIQEVNPGILLPSKVHKNSHSEDALIYALEDVGSTFNVKYDEGGWRNDEIVISEYHARELDLEVGDDLALELPHFDEEKGYSTVMVTWKVSGIHSSHFGYYIFVNLGRFQSMTNLTGKVNIIYLQTVDGDESQDLENRLITTTGVSSVTYRTERADFMDQYLDLIISVTYMIAMLSTALAAAIVYNLFMINAEEKNRDYATMKTLGTSQWKLGKLIFLEAGFILVFGIVLGTIGGYLIALGFIQNSPQLDMLNIKVIFSWSRFALGASLIISVVVLVSMLTIRYIGRIKIANVIRERSTG